MIYEFIGRVVVKALLLMYGRQIRFVAAGTGVALTALAAAAYLASRKSEEEA